VRRREIRAQSALVKCRRSRGRAPRGKQTGAAKRKNSNAGKVKRSKRRGWPPIRRIHKSNIPIAEQKPDRFRGGRSHDVVRISRDSTGSIRKLANIFVHNHQAKKVRSLGHSESPKCNGE
jgi:hypothetical protein